MIARTNVERKAYAEWLCKYHWDYMLTVTFRSPRRDPIPALKHVYNELEKHNVRRAFLGVEPHQSGDLHIHGIVAGNYGVIHGIWQPEISMPDVIWSGLFKRFGRAKVELCKTLEAVTTYCSKYILKQQNRVADYYEVYGNAENWDRYNLENPYLTSTN